ncbi:integrase arm-type DNA-binding domain-containing protein [Lysobacter sp. KIS68-7]|uniref:tyrosine-type recombinase/integrase n=1 Tax=Lysobacter sp. KIS68-7 TaxID=2904252 RepID=UPI001E311D5F|nr:site-specific integrase [Lysobacter sp. KIS68-7]UHQ19081.1 integrase arm-type DNA-binding domain-containing protein [Lysobacter sp. KIS68-7]
MPLSDTAIQALKCRAGARFTKYHDRDGLFVYVFPSGTKSFVLRYRIHGAERSFSLGRYPTVTLKRARERATAIRGQIADGVDPVQDKRRRMAAAAAHDAARFTALADDWRKRQTWTSAVRAQYDRLFERDILPALGRLPVADVAIDDVQCLVDSVAERGKVVAGHVLLLVRGVLKHAVAKKLAPYNVAREVQAPKRERGAKKSYRHLEATADVRMLIERIEGYNGNLETKIALMLLVLTFVRPSELREATWPEFDLDAIDADGQAAPSWSIPGERMKRGRPHVVPLSTQAVLLLRNLKELTGHARHLFPNARDSDKPMARNTFIRALRDYMRIPTTAHGVRHLASTTLNSQGWNRDWIELQLAHWNEGVRGAYNKAQWLPDRRRMMQAYADWLDRVRTIEPNVIPLRRAS